MNLLSYIKYMLKKKTLSLVYYLNKNDLHRLTWFRRQGISMVKSKYSKKQIIMEGIIVGIKDSSVSMDFKGRLVYLSILRRMLISDYELKLG